MRIRHGAQQSILPVKFALKPLLNKVVLQSSSNKSNGVLFRDFEDIRKYDTQYSRSLGDVSKYEALKAAGVMLQQSIPMSRDHVYSLLQQCLKQPDLQCSRHVQTMMMHNQLDSIEVLANHIIRLFTACGGLVEANQAFNRVAQPTDYTWIAIVTAHFKGGQGQTALQLYGKSCLENNKYLYVALLQACIAASNLESGRYIHEQIFKSGLQSDLFVGSSLVDMYAKCGSLEDACKVFEKLENRDMVSWCTMIAAYVQNGKYHRALECFEKMQQEAIKPEKVALLSVLKSCGSTGTIQKCRCMHELVIECGFQCDVFLTSMLVYMYAKCGSLKDAESVFDKLLDPDIVSWDAMIEGYAQHRNGPFALNCFENMQQSGLKPNEVTFLSILKACGSTGDLLEGRRIHVQIIESGFYFDTSLGNMLLSMYASCGSMDEAYRIFYGLPYQDAISWGTMIAGYARHGDYHLALRFFDEMQYTDIKLERNAVMTVLKVCGSIGATEKGRRIHQELIETGLQSDECVLSSVIEMYMRNGCLGEARDVFDNLQNRDIVLWGVMIAGYAQNGEGLLALQCFSHMQQEGIKPNKAILLSVLKGCGSVGAIDQGRTIHNQIIENGFDSDVSVGNALVDMYGKCGALVNAKNVFDKLAKRDVISWNALIAAHAHQNITKAALHLFNEMEKEGIKPNEVTYIIVLVACNHAGLADAAYKYFKSMTEDNGIMPTASHYACMADILACAGRLNEAENLLQTCQPLLIEWMSLLSACRKHSNVELGRRCFDRIVHLDSSYAAGYVLMSSIYSSAFRWKDAAHIEELRQRAGAWKKPAKAWIEVDNEVHEFIVGDKSHPDSEEIYGMLKMLNNRMKQSGYTPKINSMFQSMSDEEKQEALCGHCEKLAVAFGLIRTSSGTTIRATKNLRMCMDCHSATKVISKIESREIIIRDTHCMHHFKEGSCSCGDYNW